MYGQILEEEAEVLRTEGRIAWIDTQRKSTCTSCSARKGCGTGTLAQVLGQRKTEMSALNPIGARAGHRVVVGISSGALIKGSLAVYSVPLILLFAMAGFGHVLGSHLHANDPQGWSIAFALLGLVVAFFWVARFGVRIRDNPQYQPVILRIVSESAVIPIRPVSGE